MSLLGTPYIAAGGHSSSGATLTVTVGVAPGTQGTAAGDAIAVWATINGSAFASPAVTDSQGNTYTLTGAAVSNGAPTGAWFVSLNSAALVSGTDTITLTLTGTAGNRTMTAYGCAGVVQASALDQAPTPATGTSTAPSVTSGALAQSSELALAGLVNGNPGGAVTWGGSFASPVVSDSEHPASNQWGQSAVITTTSAAALTASGTITSTIWGITLITLQSVNPVGNSRVGTTIPNLALSTGACITNPAEGCYDAGLSQDQADRKFTTAVARSLRGTGRLAVTKKFWTQVNNYNLSINNLANYATYGTKVLFALTPPLTGGTAADKTLLANFLTGIKGKGFNASNCAIILWQEPENGNHFGNGQGGTGTGPSGYQTQMAFFGPTVNASGLPLAQDVGMGAGVNTASNYLNAGYASGVTFAAQYADFYYGAWHGGITLDAVAAIANTQGLPFGLGEWGSTAAVDYASYQQYILQFFTGLQQTGQAIADVCRYEGQCSLTGINDLTSPIVSSTDPRIPGYQAIFDALTSTRPANTVTVANPGTQVNSVSDVVSLQITAADSDPSQTFTYSASGLPAGLTINRSTGIISGTVTTAGNSSVTVTATDGTGVSGQAGFAWTVNRVVTNTVTVTSPGNQASQVGASVNLQMAATDSNVGITTFTWAAAALPAGLAINTSTGLITGTLTAPGILNVTITATDVTGSFGTASFTWAVALSTTLTAGKFVTLPPVTPSPVASFGLAGQLSYEIAFGLTAGAASSVPWCAMTLQFFDFDQAPAHQTPVAAVTYRCPMGTVNDPNGPAVVSGRGPMRGAYMRVQAHNADSVDASLSFFQLVGVSRNVDRDDWRWDCGGNSPVIPSYTNATAATASLVLGGVSGLSVPHGTTVTRLVSMFAGEVALRVRLFSGGPTSIGVKVTPQPASLFSSQDLFNKTVGNAGDDNFYTLFLPRGACLLSLVGDPSTDATVSAELIALET